MIGELLDLPAPSLGIGEKGFELDLEVLIASRAPDVQGCFHLHLSFVQHTLRRRR